jgi:glycosyltransferase involved in cell wall biosynthesis
MKIFFDHQAFTMQRFGGISRYYCELILGINSTSIGEAHLSLLSSNNENLKEYNFEVTKFPFPEKHRLYKCSNYAFNIADLFFNKYDIYHATYFEDILIKYVKGAALVTTFYDMTYEILSKDFVQLSRDKSVIKQKEKIANQSSHLIAISESTKKDMVNILGINPEKISVVYLAGTFNLCEPNINIKIDQQEQPYLLFVGNRDSYKNFSTMLKAIAPVLLRHDIRLICAGGGTFTNNDYNFIQSLNLSDKVEYQDINDAKLQLLYSGAVAFIFPSLYEGFGIPVLEAFACNCPCILSNVSSLPEISGDAALYFDPRDTDSIKNAVEKVIADNNVRDELINKGRIRLSHFSWYNTVSKTLTVYERLLN